MHKAHRLRNLRIAKYTTNIGVFVALAVIGSIYGLPEDSPLIYNSVKVNAHVLMPVIFSIFGSVAVMKDQLMSYFKLPKGVNTAIILFAIGLVGWLLSYWLMIITGVYLLLTLTNSLYFNPGIDEELEYKKEQKKKTGEIAK